MKAGEFIIRLFHARTVAHVLHLKSRSYAQHKALNEFYDEIIPLVDSYAETFQGAYGVISEYSGGYRNYNDPVVFIEELCDWVKDNRSEFCARTDTHLLNIIDEVSALIDTTKYKLKVLK